MFDLWPVMNKCTVVAKRELFYAWPFGLAAWLSGLIFINRMQTDKARNSLYAAADIIRQKRIKLWIFPEGTRRNTGTLHAFKKGAFHVAIAGQLPILPVVFSSYRTFLDDKCKSLTAGECKDFVYGFVLYLASNVLEINGVTSTEIKTILYKYRKIMLNE